MSTLPNSPVTSKMIAQQLGITTASVSYAFSSEKSSRKLSPAMRDKILALAKELNYVPNQMARSLKYQKSFTVGLVLADLLADWAHRLLLGLMETLETAQYTPIISLDLWDSDRQRRECDSLLSRQVEGLFLNAPSPNNRDYFKAISERGIPVIFLGDSMDNPPPLASSVLWDEQRATARALEHLLAQGRRRIWYMESYSSTIDSLHTQQRQITFRTTLQRAGIECPENSIQSIPQHGPVEAMSALFNHHRGQFDAIFTVNDILGRYALEALTTTGIKVPEEVAVASLCDHPISENRFISLTSVHQPLRQMGRDAGQLMLDLIYKRRSSPVHLLNSQDRLATRNSTVLGMNDPWIE